MEFESDFCGNPLRSQEGAGETVQGMEAAVVGFAPHG